MEKLHHSAGRIDRRIVLLNVPPIVCGGCTYMVQHPAPGQITGRHGLPAPGSVPVYWQMVPASSLGDPGTLGDGAALVMEIRLDTADRITGGLSAGEAAVTLGS